MKNVVVVGGGTGTFTLIEGLKKYPANISVIVSTADDGGSTGRLRKELGVMPPGDIRQCLVGLSTANQSAKDLFSYRFGEGELRGHTAGNIIIAGLEKLSGGIEGAIKEAGKILKVRGKIIPVTSKPSTLIAELSNGMVIQGEHEIDEPKVRREVRIRNLELRGGVVANPKAIKAIINADAIVFGPGDLFTSILPNILPKGMAAALQKAKGKKILVVNIMTKPGQTDGFKASDFAAELQKYAGIYPDVVIANTVKPEKTIAARYKRQGSAIVKADVKNIPARVITGNFLSTAIFMPMAGDALQRSVLRHDSKKMAKVIYSLI